MKTNYGVKFIFGGVSEVKNAIENIQNYVEYQEETIKHLREENNRLKSENYKDEELTMMQARVSELEKGLSEMRKYGFSISKEEHDAIMEWQRKHEEEVHGAVTLEQKMRRGGAIGGNYSYHFVPTSIGVFGKVKCSCGAEFEFQEL